MNDPNNVYNQTLGSLPDSHGNTNDHAGTNVVMDTDMFHLTTPTGPLDYEVWAASWYMPSWHTTHYTSLSVVPFIWVKDPNTEYVGPATPSTDDDYLNQNSYTSFKTTLVLL